MNNEEARYRFRRTVAEVLQALSEPEGPVQDKRRGTLDIIEGRDWTRPG